MSDVKAAVRALRVFETFATEVRPLNLTELAARLEIAPSSCLLLIRTLLRRGYLYETAARGGYYPTKRMLELSARIGRHDPVIERLLPGLEALRDRTQETVTLTKRQGDRAIYLAILDSPQTLRPSVTVGTLRPIYCTAAGKALLGALDAPQRRRILEGLDIKRLTSRTITSRAQIEAEIALMAVRGWYSNDGETEADLGAIGVPIMIDKEIYAVTVLGPATRINPRLGELAPLLVKACAQIGKSEKVAGSVRGEPATRRATSGPSRGAVVARRPR